LQRAFLQEKTFAGKKRGKSSASAV